ncbi:redoxin domain-containing protein [Dankookia rubra]|uniref:Redoxin domain-containing protein n=1 Tax=Dankookia rubra TaxID=1442381 RepID=A0A4V3A9X6_9PROT|nr:redoxin family protein [Dankookia rubra]TDH60905.1 redoxin domain-containing protein [Dankookia rubra]
MPTRRSLAPLLLAAGPLATGRGAAQSPAGGPAPEFAGLDGWLNSPAPLTLGGLRGKVVLVDFWTYSCINCRRTIPYLNRFQAEYGARGLQVVGIHTPEFGFERMRRNLEPALRELGIAYPVGQDNDFRTWRAWSNRAWPAFYLLDRDGRIVLVREGEGHARELEGAIRALLGLAPAAARPGDDPDLSRVRSPEVYFGALHPTPQDRAQSPRRGEATYAFPARGPALDAYQLDGAWAREEEALVLRSPRGGLRLRFSAAKLHLVAGAPDPVRLGVAVDGGAARAVEVGRPTLYTLLDGTAHGEHLIELTAGTPGLSLFSATFG